MRRNGANGPLGYASYQTRFQLPDNRSRHAGWRGNWYSFQVGSALFVFLDANDVVYAGSANPANPNEGLYIHGYSGGAQTGWLERTLAAARLDPDIDWIIAVHHQPIISSSASGGGGDLGLRQQFMPLFDRYRVDLTLWPR